mgnify:CR=1 FL=1
MPESLTMLFVATVRCNRQFSIQLCCDGDSSPPIRSRITIDCCTQAAVGTGFGGILCTIGRRQPPCTKTHRSDSISLTYVVSNDSTSGPVVAAHFPGGNEGHFPVLFGIVLLWPSVGLLLIGKITGALTPPTIDCWVVENVSATQTTLLPLQTSFYEDCRFGPSLSVAIISAVATAVAVRFRTFAKYLSLVFFA